MSERIKTKMTTTHDIPRSISWWIIRFQLCIAVFGTNIVIGVFLCCSSAKQRKSYFLLRAGDHIHHQSSCSIFERYVQIPLIDCLSLPKKSNDNMSNDTFSYLLTPASYILSKVQYLMKGSCIKFNQQWFHLLVEFEKQYGLTAYLLRCWMVGRGHRYAQESP